MVIDRRKLLAAMLASLCAGKDARAGILRQRLFISCRMDAAGNASLACFTARGREVFAVALPARGHDVTPRPGGTEAVVFARRPGDWFMVLGSGGGELRAVVHAPLGRHLYGHGAFTHDGRLLHVTENDIATGDGVIGVYDASDGYKRAGEYPSGGIGPHDIALLPDGRAFMIANGGLRTHPDTGRETLNPGDLKPNLALVDAKHGKLLASHQLGHEFRQLSIRHLAVRHDGLVAFGCQYQGSPDDMPPLLGSVSPSHGAVLFGMPEDALARLQNYVGSVAFDDSGEYLMATSPRGGNALIWKMAENTIARSIAMSDVCGAEALGPGRFIATSGNSGMKEYSANPEEPAVSAQISSWIWDNHTAMIWPA